MRYLKDRWANQLAQNTKIEILHNPDPKMSCGIGMFGLKKGDPGKLASELVTKYRIYTTYMPNEEYTGIRVTPSVYTTLQELDYFVSAVQNELKNV